MTAIDATGLAGLGRPGGYRARSGRGLILCGAREQPARLMHQAEFEQHVGAGNICSSIADALERAKTIFPLVEQHEAWTSWGRRSSDANELVNELPRET